MYNPDVHHRRSIRLKKFDYSQPGYYFITICTYEKRLIFGQIINGEMILNQYGEVAKNELITTQQKRTNIKIDEYMIMPNHIHCVMCISENKDNYQTNKGHEHRAPTTTEQFSKPTVNSIPTIVRVYKSVVTKQLRDMAIEGYGVWQRDYYEHVVRGEEELKKIKEYIINNPKNWNKDKLFSL